MAGRALPGIGLIADWALGEDNWKDEMDSNLLKLSVLIAGVNSIEDATPGAPVEGDRHIFSAAHPTDPNKVAVYDEATWKTFTPAEGVELFNNATNVRYRFVDGGWSAVALVMNQATYDAIPSPDPNTIYYITA